MQPVLEPMWIYQLVREGRHDDQVLHRDRRRALSFGVDAPRYDRARPGYPLPLVDYLLSDGARSVLDVGCGTGIAARLFVERGCEVLGVEPDERMAVAARGTGLTVEAGSFEDWDPAGSEFDLLICAQAWHWIDPMIGAQKAAAVLRRGGRIGLFWNQGTTPTELAKRFDEVYAQHAPGLDGYSLLAGAGEPENLLNGPAAALAATGAFTEILILTFSHDREYTTHEWLDQLPTHSDHQQLEPTRLKLLLAGIGNAIDEASGAFVMHYDTLLLTAKALAE